MSYLELSGVVPQRSHSVPLTVIYSCKENKGRVLFKLLLVGFVIVLEICLRRRSPGLLCSLRQSLPQWRICRPEVRLLRRDIPARHYGRREYRRVTGPRPYGRDY